MNNSGRIGHRREDELVWLYLWARDGWKCKSDSIRARQGLSARSRSTLGQKSHGMLYLPLTQCPHSIIPPPPPQGVDDKTAARVRHQIDILAVWGMNANTLLCPCLFLCLLTRLDFLCARLRRCDPFRDWAVTCSHECMAIPRNNTQVLAGPT